MRSTLVLIGAFGLSTFTSVATATTACERLSTVHLDHAVVTWADPAITAQNTIRYYESVLQKMGPEQGNWVRLFMLPGMGHCRGGPGLNGFDSTRAIEQWVEQGIAPNQLEGHGANGLTRPLCPYPQAAEYSGSGDPKDGRNWSCKGEAPKGKP